MATADISLTSGMWNVLLSLQVAAEVTTVAGDVYAFIFSPGPPATGNTTYSSTISSGSNTWVTTSGIQPSALQLESALSVLRTQSSKLSARLSVVTTRQFVITGLNKKARPLVAASLSMCQLS